MGPRELVLRSRRVVREGTIGPAAVHVQGGVIAAITRHDDLPRDAEVVDAGDLVVMPGVVDCHVHVNEPGRTEWEGFETATRAAAAGGITTIVDMPLNSDPVTTTLAALRAKEESATPRCWVDHSFWGGVIPGNQGELEPLMDAGLPGFKCFLVHSGIDDFPDVTEKDLRIAMPILARRGSVLLVHAEVPGPMARVAAEVAKGAKERYATFLASRPRASEDEAVALMIALCRETGCRVHIVHLSSASAIPALVAARREGLPITVETCPHYLTFTAEEVPDRATHYKCCPPIRERENRERLWAALAEGAIDMVVSDHSPCPPAMKLPETGDFAAAWGGISALQLSLPLVWTGARERGHGLERVVEWMCRAPARLVGIERRKGALEVGLDADLVLFDPDRTFAPAPETIHHRHKVTPAAGRTLRGVVQATFLRGQKVFENGAFLGGPAGRRVR
jgi:allantoinase